MKQLYKILIIVLIIVFCMIMISCSSHRREAGMEKAFNNMGDYYEECRTLGHDTSAQFNDKVYCKSEIDGIIMLYPIINDGG